jgi:signal transduction histidine kinase
LRLRVEYLPNPVQRERAIRDIEEMQALMTDTLTLARLEHGTVPTGPFDLGKVVARQVSGFLEAGSRVDFQPAAELMVNGSAPALARAVSNLISNAVKHAGGAEVSLKADGTDVELWIEDRGPGIPANLRELALEPFFRGDEARNLDAPGFGLGLAIVADIVRRHGGKLALEDRPGGGLRARIVLSKA